MIVSLLLAWAGATLHVTGHWALFGTLDDGSYYVSTPSMIVAAVIVGGPLAAVGAAVYVLARARLREAWKADYRTKAVADEWSDREEFLERTARRFG